MVSIKHICNDDYLTNSQISKSYIVYSDLTKLTLHDKAKLHSLKLCLTQKEIYRIDGKEVSLRTGEFLMVNPNQKFEVIADNKNTKGLCLFFDSEEMGGVDDFIFSNDKYQLEKENSLKSRINKVFEIIKGQKSNISEIDLKSLFDDIITSEKIEYYSTNKLPLSISKNRAEIANSVLKGKNFIDNNIYEKLSIDNISDSVYISKYYFIRLFKDLFGTTPYKYLTEKKLEESKRLLKNNSIEETALRLHFTDRSAFSNKFHKQFGIRPSKYKSMIS